jgi:hypothetical protein
MHWVCLFQHWVVPLDTQPLHRVVQSSAVGVPICRHHIISMEGADRELRNIPVDLYTMSRIVTSAFTYVKRGMLTITLLPNFRLVHLSALL